MQDATPSRLAPRPAKPGKDKDSKKQKGLAAEVAALRVDVDALKTEMRARGGKLQAAPSAEADAIEAHLEGELSASTDASVLYAFAYRADGSGTTVTGSRHVCPLPEILRAGDDRVARIGYALSSVPKVALVRSLLTEGPQSAAQLGEKAGLSTGSLYHHLRELAHAEVIHQTGRNRYGLTALGQHAALLLFTLAS